MTLSVGRGLFMKLYGNGLSRLSRIIAVKFSDTAYKDYAEPVVIPDLEPNKIQAAVLKEFYKPLVIENVELPKLQENEVLVDVHYCTMNAADLLLCRNMYTFEPKLPMILGYEITGKLVAIGTEAEKQGYKVGDKVIALNKERFGGLAEKCVAEVANIWKIPPMISSLDAVSMLHDYIIALLGLERTVNINENDIILINVGISGISLAAVDLATNVFKAKVIGICATVDGAEQIREKGAFVAFKYNETKLLKEIKIAAAERDIQAIFDDVGGDYLKRTLSCFTDIYKDATLKDLLRDDNFGVVVYHLSRKGRLIIAGTTVTINEEIQLNLRKSSFSITGFNLQEYKARKPDEYRQAGDEVLQFIEDGLIVPNDWLHVGLYNINKALKYVFESQNPEKIIINMRNKDDEL